MTKRMSLMLGVSLVLGTVTLAFADDPPAPTNKKVVKSTNHTPGRPAPTKERLIRPKPVTGVMKNDKENKMAAAPKPAQPRAQVNANGVEANTVVNGKVKPPVVPPSSRNAAKKTKKAT